MVTKPYNIFELDISNGLKALPVGTAGGYISLLEAPTNAHVKIHLNEREADGIPLKAYHAIEATNIEQIFVTADAVADEKITIVQSIHSDSFKMITPASDVNVDEVTQIVKPVENGIYTTDALAQLDKIMNPYLPPTSISGESNSTDQVDILDYTPTCDKIRVNLNITRKELVRSYGRSVGIVLAVDGIYISKAWLYIEEHNTANAYIELENIKNKNIVVTFLTDNDVDYGSYYIQEYTLKP